MHNILVLERIMCYCAPVQNMTCSRKDVCSRKTISVHIDAIIIIILATPFLQVRTGRIFGATRPFSARSSLPTPQRCSTGTIAENKLQENCVDWLMYVHVHGDNMRISYIIYRMKSVEFLYRYISRPFNKK